MKIKLQNTIKMDDQVEVFHEVYEGELKTKGDWLYLTYQNSEKEQVVIKLSHTELVMTRFSNPQTQMKFLAGGLAPATVPTPMGLQRLVTKTHGLTYDARVGVVAVTYDLLTNPEASLPLATYDLRLSWGE